MFFRILKDERGLVFRNGNYERYLKPGGYFLPSLLGYEVRIFDVNEAFSPHKNIKFFQTDKALLEELEIIEIPDKNIALHFVDGHIQNYLYPGIYSFWKVIQKHEFQIFNLEEAMIPAEVSRSVLQKDSILPAYNSFEVESYEKGLLFYNGKFQKILDAGRYDFWKGPVKVRLEKVDMRQQQLEVSGQELLSKDRITLRLNFICQYKIINPERAILEIKSYVEQIYTLMQLVLRDHISSVPLDELLEKRQDVANAVLTELKKEEQLLGIEFIKAGIKDVILPGEIRDILNLVLIAEKKAQANIITRREETASTRSLLNTARLMDDNPTLYKLKELEYLEKFSEKVGKIQVNGNGNLLELLSEAALKKSSKM
ncbi:MAG: slipin family protein [Leptospiraceae bacterium]|nr:slipin family protein [Leptospiraceae bacterium]MCP5502555.1 slipin family protein [Leptospiraceae bacterium]